MTSMRTTLSPTPSMGKIFDYLCMGGDDAETIDIVTSDMISILDVVLDNVGRSFNTNDATCRETTFKEAFVDVLNDLYDEYSDNEMRVIVGDLLRLNEKLIGEVERHYMEDLLSCTVTVVSYSRTSLVVDKTTNSWI